MNCPKPQEFESEYTKTYNHISTLIAQYKVKNPASTYPLPGSVASGCPGGDACIAKTSAADLHATVAYRKSVYVQATPTSAACNPNLKDATHYTYQASCIKTCT